MLTVTIPSREYFDNASGLFHYTKEATITLEHSLVSLSKWESRWCKPFNDGSPKTMEEIIDYIRCMTITQNVPNDVYANLSKDTIDEICAYIDAPMTATTFRRRKAMQQRHETVTAEIIYYWMFSYNIPLECQKWHLNRLLTLIRVFNEKNAPEKKTSYKDTVRRNRAINAARKSKLGTRG